MQEYFIKRLIKTSQYKLNLWPHLTNCSLYPYLISRISNFLCKSHIHNFQLCLKRPFLTWQQFPPVPSSVPRTASVWGRSSAVSVSLRCPPGGLAWPRTSGTGLSPSSTTSTCHLLSAAVSLHYCISPSGWMILWLRVNQWIHNYTFFIYFLISSNSNFISVLSRTGKCKAWSYHQN